MRAGFPGNSALCASTSRNLSSLMQDKRLLLTKQPHKTFHGALRHSLLALKSRKRRAHLDSGPSAGREAHNQRHKEHGEEYPEQNDGYSRRGRRDSTEPE